MLVGNHSLVEAILERGYKIAEERGLKIVFASQFGSLSYGSEHYNSDFDIRFLYIKKDEFPDIRKVSDDLQEADAMFRYIPEDFKKICHHFPFWEMTAFLNFLTYPVLDGKFSYGLYNAVPWTLASPFSIDPFGLSQKLMPLAGLIFNEQYAIGYFMELLTANYHQGEQIVNVKNYIRAIRAVLSVEWILHHHTFAPVHIQTLLAESQDCELVALARTYLKQLAQFDVGKKTEEMLFLSGSPYISARIETLFKSVALKKFREINAVPEKNCHERKIIDQMYQLVADSIQPKKIFWNEESGIEG